jgi:prepilin-type N-terminal cleavage/methylation domain-containing protein
VTYEWTLSNRRELRSKAGGFTLVELLIVVIILAILAAVVIPQFAASTDDARAAALDTTLANLRSSLDLYYQQHGEYPSANGDGSNAAASAAAFISQLSQYTDADGDAAATKDATHIYGPYLRKGEIPTEPMTNSAAIEIITTGTLGITASGGDPGGWKFDNVTGQFIVNDAAYDDR